MAVMQAMLAILAELMTSSFQKEAQNTQDATLVRLHQKGQHLAQVIAQRAENLICRRKGYVSKPRGGPKLPQSAKALSPVAVLRAYSSSA